MDRARAALLCIQTNPLASPKCRSHNGEMRNPSLVAAALAAASVSGIAAADPASMATETASSEAPPSPAELVEAGQSWVIDTPRGHVRVWIPDGYDAETAATIVYVHGYYADVDHAWVDQKLPEQFAISGLNAMFIACGAPESASEPVTWPSLRQLLAAVRTGIHRALPARHLVAVGHSGAHRTLVRWLGDRDLDTVVLVDAAYGELEPYRAWLHRSKAHRFIDIASDTMWRTDPFHRTLPGTKTVDHFPSADEGTFSAAARDARILYVRATREHMQLVTDGVALPLTLRALHVPLVQDASRSEPLSPLPQPDEAASGAGDT